MAERACTGTACSPLEVPRAHPVPLRLPDVDHMDIGVRQENLQVRGEPIMLQLCVVPAYALTIHKTQGGLFVD